ncbi:related to glutathione S-transferase GST-6.0 [Ramularia collo-cygni]|uniref:Related to glutathione S-transferase GST-6.0 n=1 Tax=Ramularia collo-cygni TaxID=112498 RepID=A0A2D3UP81_9PEZI|nr:related to glutathione S-transferase GST-6.0 [Ramularia collo-cygni]CZT14575.1 related to glutathione S-transferase GST-6.0 [Ramularia collo-cygni]
MAPQIKLYYSPNACSMAPQLLLEDAGLAYEAIKVSYDPQERADFVKNVNPKGQVPALVIDGVVVTEAPAIITAISHLVPEKNYIGKTPMDNVRFYEWLNYLSGNIHGKAFGGLFAPSKYSTDAAAEAGIREKAKESVLAGFKVVEDKLAALGGPQYALGDSLTGVDAYLTTFIIWAQKFQLDLSPFPNYTKLYEGISQTPAWKSVVAKQA